MKELIIDFAGQIEKGLAIYNANIPKAIGKKYSNIVISGLGGSGIGGTIMKDISTLYCPIPVVVNKEYAVPAFINNETLFIASSYSGDTEETIAATRSALEKQATVICISSGGTISKLAGEKGLDLLQIPGGTPPRANLGYSLTQLICIFADSGYVPASYKTDLANSVNHIRKNQESIIENARKIAAAVLGKRIIIYSDASHEGVAVRFRQQLNENSKLLCWHHVVPEMNHNELVGWAEQTGNLAVFFIRNTTDHPRNQHRMEINKGIINGHTDTVIELWGEGTNEVERTMYLIHLVDWISFFLADLQGVDIMDIRVIDYLKKKLSEID